MSNLHSDPSGSNPQDQPTEITTDLPRQVNKPDEVITDENYNVLDEQEQSPGSSSEPPKQVNRPDEIISEEQDNVANEEEPATAEVPEEKDDKNNKEKGYREGIKDDSTTEPEQVDSDDQPAFPEEEG
ncbi:MAG: hypothetical protein JWP81_2006 [Ferruginibacter sp.]|nr:hypothetical protein [Ferruginibacter sp.]